MKELVSPNTTLSHYRIISKLGAGGMGEVWLAEDTRLKRKVALKLLPAELTSDADRVRRFEQEAQAASALSHPNIITVYDIGECEAGRFIVMELVAGRTLRAVIAENNSLENLLTLGAQMAKALSAAHAAGITHRDIKPDNIMVRDDGYVKVLDFGLARLRRRAEGGGMRDEDSETLLQQTMPGTVMGTVAYMSPEQARGETVSHPSDVFALGIVLYELATGRHPFKAETLVGYLHAITLQEPAPLMQWKLELPAALNALILRMLSKDARERPTASEVAQALREIERQMDRASGEAVPLFSPSASLLAAEVETQILPPHTPAATPNLNSIAVLPFANISADEENEYFCDGLAEELLNALAKIGELKVAARTSAFSFKGKNAEAREIGKTLNVNTVLEGSVRKAGNRIRINVQLVNAADGYQLWSERYDREMKDIFDVQDEITLAVVDALKVKLLGAKKAAVMKRYTDNTEAYQLYLKGRFQFGKYTEAGWGKAIEYFEQALALESDYAPAYAGIAEACSSLWYFGYDARPEVIARERAAIARALEIEAELADAWRSKAQLQFFIDWDFSAAEQSLARALALNPNDALTHAWHAVWLTAMGRREEAVTAARRARELDPFSLVSGIIAGWTLIFAERYEESMGVAQALLEIDPHFSEAYRLLGTCHWALENYAAAEDALQQALVGEAVPLAWANLCGVYAHAGRQAEARQIVQQIRAMREQHYVPAVLLAYCYAFLDEVEEAFVWLEQAFAERNGELVFWGVLPEQFVSFRHDPRFTDLLRRIGLPTEEPPQTDESLEANTMLLTPNVSSKPAGAPWAATSTQRHTVGREPERNELRTAFNAARDGRGSLLCVAGEPGIGKTTLVEDFLAELTADRHCTIARGRCSERLAGTEAYLPLLEALESLLAADVEQVSNLLHREKTGVVEQVNNLLHREKLKQLAPTWYAQVMPLAGDSEESARLLNEVKAASQERMKRELASFLQAVATPQPLVIFFDDLHWADVSTIDLLSFLAGKFDALRVLIVVTYRPSDMLLVKHPFLQIKPDLQVRGLCRELLLEFLTDAEIAEYLTLEFPRHAFPPDFAKLIHAKTEGSPLFMADLVRYLRDRGVIRRTDFSLLPAPEQQTEVCSTWALEQTLPDIERELPESVRGMIERKIAQLGEDDRKLLTCASVQGYEFDSAVVAQVLKLDADEVEERLEKLERVFAFVKLTSEAEFPNGALTLKYRFVHVLYQNALYAGLRATRKATHSRDVALALEACYAADSASVANELAVLWEAARDYARASDSFLQAARNAVQVNAHREAVQLAERGLAALLKSPETPERDGRELSLQLTLGFSLQSVLSWAAPEAGAAFNRARQLCRQMGDDPRLVAALSGVTIYHLMRAEFVIVKGLCEQIMQLAEQAQDPVLLVMASMHWAAVHFYQGEPVSAHQHGERALALDRREYHEAYFSFFNEDLGIMARRTHSYSLWALGYPDRALALAQESITLAEQTSHPFSLGGAHFTTGTVLYNLRDWQSSQQEFEKVIALAEEYALGDFLNYAITWNALTLAYQEPTEAALERAKQAIESLRATGVTLAMTGLLASLGEVFRLADRCAEGLETIAEALALIERTGDRVYETELWRIKGELLLRAVASNARAEAESCYRKAIEIARQQSAKSWELRAATSLARLWQRQGKSAEARQMLAEIYGWFTEGFDTADLQEAKALLDELNH